MTIRYRDKITGRYISEKEINKRRGILKRKKKRGALNVVSELWRGNERQAKKPFVIRRDKAKTWERAAERVPARTRAVRRPPPMVYDAQADFDDEDFDFDSRDIDARDIIDEDFEERDDVLERHPELNDLDDIEYLDDESDWYHE